MRVESPSPAPLAAVDEPFDTPLADHYAYDLGAGTLSTAGGLLVPSTAAGKVIHRTDGKTFTDLKAMLKIHTGSMLNVNWETELVLKYLDASNWLALGFWWAGASDLNLGLSKSDGGVISIVSSSSAAIATATGTDYWLVGRVSGNKFRVDLYADDPRVGFPALTSDAFSLSGANATKYGAGVAGGVGLRLYQSDVNFYYDDHMVVPTSGSLARSLF